MKKILFYCQNLLGMGHLVRTTELIRALAKDFQVCLMDGGQKVAGFELPPSVTVVQLPIIQVVVSETHQVSKQLQVVGSTMTLEEAKEFRKQVLIQTYDQFQPDCLITEGYPFSKNKALAFEMEPLLEHVKQSGYPTQIICSLRDIIMVKEFIDRTWEERRRCAFTDQYYDAILLHSDPIVHRFEDNLTQQIALNCPIHYTGYVVQSEPDIKLPVADQTLLNHPAATIVVSIGGGRLGHDLLESMIQAAPLLAAKIPHRIIMFAGPLMEEAQYDRFVHLAQGLPNLVLRRFTPNLMAFLQRAELSISLGGYNTTMNLLKTGVRAMIYPSNKDREQAIRAEKLERLNLLKVLDSDDLAPTQLAQAIVNYLYLTQAPALQQHALQLNGAQEASRILQTLLQPELVAA
jgi:predicted glycosyltransferase